MPLINGPVACTRFNYFVTLDKEPDFDLVPFKPLQKDSVLRESEGFIPFLPEEDWKVGHDFYAFKVRIDKRTPNSKLVEMRLSDLVRDSPEPVTTKVRSKLKLQVEEEILQQTLPIPTTIECVMKAGVLYVGTVSKGQLGVVLELLKRIGVECEYKTPWMNAEEEPISEYVDIKEPGQSILGCQFMRKLINDVDVFIEPEKGSVKIITSSGTKVSLSAEVLSQTDYYQDQECEFLSAKVLIEGILLTFDGFAYRISGMKLDTENGDHWHEILEARLDKIIEIWDFFDQKYETSMG